MLKQFVLQLLLSIGVSEDWTQGKMFYRISGRGNVLGGSRSSKLHALILEKGNGRKYENNI